MEHLLQLLLSLLLVYAIQAVRADDRVLADIGRLSILRPLQVRVLDAVLHAFQLPVFPVELLHGYLALYFPHRRFLLLRPLLSDLLARVFHKLEEMYLETAVIAFESAERDRNVQQFGYFTGLAHLMQAIKLCLSFTLVYGQGQSTLLLLLFCLRQLQIVLCLVFQLGLCAT